MPQADYNRYSILEKGDGTYYSMPHIELPINVSDKYEYWNEGFSRLDKLSQKYYGNPFFDFLILLANSEFSSEFDIPSEHLIRIPFPLIKAKGDYERLLTLYKNGLI
jgi:hypothetical protein